MKIIAGCEGQIENIIDDSVMTYIVRIAEEKLS